ncbi:MAG: hypothetical protein JWN34_5283, partial [Bryobacterales bacterium]|nr:hypothetical protein [Bryobacterales bacterium]
MSSNTHYLDELGGLDSGANRFFVENTRAQPNPFRPDFARVPYLALRERVSLSRRTIEIQPAKVRFSLPADPSRRSKKSGFGKPSGNSLDGTEVMNCGSRWGARSLRCLPVLVIAGLLLPAQSIVAPSFRADPAWLHLPNDWMVGNGASIAIDNHDNVWLLQRSSGLSSQNRSKAAPPVIEMDPRGNLVRAWGGPGPGYEWPFLEHTIYVDDKDQVWICGAGTSPTGVTDTIVLKFTAEGKFLMQLGKAGETGGNSDKQNMNRPSDIFVNSKSNEVFISDGYGNRRIIVFDAESGAFKRMFGAFGNVPVGDRPPGARGGAGAGGMGRGGGAAAAAASVDPAVLQTGQFQLPHSSTVSNDGNLYVVDRGTHRMQVFSLDGKFLRQVPINLEDARSSPTAVAFSRDRDQSLLYMADYGTSQVLIFDRTSLKLIGSLGSRGASPGEFQGIHDVAVDS